MVGELRASRFLPAPDKVLKTGADEQTNAGGNRAGARIPFTCLIPRRLRAQPRFSHKGHSVYKRPDYATARARAGFSWHVSATYLAYLKLADVPIRRFFLEPEACIEAYRVGRRKVRESFGEDVKLAGPATPPISYGHPNGLGCELLFPEGGEVAAEHAFADSLDRASRTLDRPVDFARAGMAPFYLRFRQRMEKAFPGESVGFSYGDEGPITTAYVLRGGAFFTDLIDEPAKTREFLRRLTRSILEFHAFRCSVWGVAPISPDGSGLCDDIASMVPPRLWREIVLPSWELYYTGKTTGTRSAHVEDLRPEQLGFLEEVGLSFYDPSISSHLDPKTIAARCRVPFLWRLGSFHYPALTVPEVEEFVFRAVADGASRVVTYIEGSMCGVETVPKVLAFIRAAKQVERLFAEGVSRQQIEGYASGAVASRK